MRDLLGAEWLKAWSGRTWWIMAAVAVFMGLLGSSGATATADHQLAEGMTDNAAATAEVIRSWFSVLLASLLFGGVFVSREYGTGAVNRSVLLSGGRTRLLLAKTIVGTAMGVLFALLAVLLAPLSLWAFFGMFGLEAEWTREATLTLVGVFAVIVLAAPWGVLLGWVIRHQAATVATLLVVTLFVDETLFALLPEVGRFTMQISMGSVYRDGKEEALSIPWALLVITGWLALAGYAARRRLVTRDVT
ncbi:ABC transporter permease [Streptomyces sp. TRM43335]|uniref:ABC transporter permease n=1 Tax=Streptomyces taklimakanensis TaxID=2569853 RepID=A0A6G2BID2_9ACTN|nr:ABC transporter permease [Streptomyces taklimakanensis]MTE21829.1 ABC transporter permease [Streptomyces taklimakanensis]